MTSAAACEPAQRAPAGPTVSVVACSYTETRFTPLMQALASLRRQSYPALELIVVIDHNRALEDRVRAAVPEARVVASDGQAGLSAARNTGAALARGEVIAFLDDDAVADAGWLAELARVYADRNVIGAGGVASPRWAGRAPRWLPREFYWTIGCSYRGLPTTLDPVRNPIGAGMSFRREVFDRIDGFDTGIGRVGATPLGCEETELSIRARAAFPQGVVLHVPTARVDHMVPTERATWRYFRARCWAEGRSKALVAGSVGARGALASERHYAIRTLPSGVVGELGAALRGDPMGAARAGAIVCGLLLTAGGYLRGRLGSSR